MVLPSYWLPVAFRVGVMLRVGSVMLVHDSIAAWSFWPILLVFTMCMIEQCRVLDQSKQAAVV
jgi:hypothetical protein